MALRNWRVQFTATVACIELAFALGDRLVVDKPPFVDEVRPKVVIRDIVHITCPECGVYQCALHASVLCPWEICVASRNWRVQFSATVACIVLAFALGDRPACG